jgi:hypothetical protein
VTQSLITRIGEIYRWEIQMCESNKQGKV